MIKSPTQRVPYEITFMVRVAHPCKVQKHGLPTANTPAAPSFLPPAACLFARRFVPRGFCTLGLVDSTDFSGGKTSGSAAHLTSACVSGTTPGTLLKLMEGDACLSPSLHVRVGAAYDALTNGHLETINFVGATYQSPFPNNLVENKAP